MPAPMPVDRGSLTNLVRALVVPIHFGPDMLPDTSMRKMMSSLMCSADLLVATHGPASSMPPVPLLTEMSIPPVPPLPPEPLLVVDVPPEPPPDVVGCGLAAGLQPHHAA